MSTVFCGVNSALCRFGLSCCIGLEGIICMFMCMCLIVYLGQLSFCIIPPPISPNYAVSYRKLILEATFPVQAHRAFLSFSCAASPPPPTLNRTYILCCLFCLFILESGKVQQGHCQFTGICVLHGPLSPLMLEGRLMYEALTQFSVPRRLLSGVNLLA